MSDAELMAEHDKLAEHTIVGTAYYLEELARREQRRQSAQALTAMAFVDAGWVRELGRRLHPNAKLDLNGTELVHWFHKNHSERLIRVYVYDGAYDETDPRRVAQAPVHARLAATPRLDLRLGRLVGGKRPTELPRQKGVDALLVLDMLEMGQRNAYDIATLFAGDADHVEAVRAVQRLGKVVNVVVPESSLQQGLASRLLEVADWHFRLAAADLDRLVVKA